MSPILILSFLCSDSLVFRVLYSVLPFNAIEVIMLCLRRQREGLRMREMGREAQVCDFSECFVSSCLSQAVKCAVTIHYSVLTIVYPVSCIFTVCPASIFLAVFLLPALVSRSDLSLPLRQTVSVALTTRLLYTFYGHNTTFSVLNLMASQCH